MKKILFFFFAIIIFSISSALAQTQALTLTTYYPAPFGMYQEMRVMGDLGVGTTDPQTKLDIDTSANTAQGAIAAGSGNMVSNQSVAIGTGNTASGNFSYARGTDNNVIDSYATAIGATNQVDGMYAMARGLMNEATANFSTAIGIDAIASNTNAFAVGSSVDAIAAHSVAFGHNNVVSGGTSTVFGSMNDVSASLAFAHGNGLDVQSYGSTVFGNQNVISGAIHTWNSTDPLFVIGNGVGGSAGNPNRSNALTVLKNGDVGLGTASPVSRLDMDGGTISLNDGNIDNDGDGDVGIVITDDSNIGLNNPNPTFPVHVSGSGVGFFGLYDPIMTVEGTTDINGNLIVGSPGQERNAYVNGFIQPGKAAGWTCNSDRSGSIRVNPVLLMGAGSMCPLEVCFNGRQAGDPVGSGTWSWKSACEEVIFDAAQPPGGGVGGGNYGSGE